MVCVLTQVLWTNNTPPTQLPLLSGFGNRWRFICILHELSKCIHVQFQLNFKSLTIDLYEEGYWYGAHSFYTSTVSKQHFSNTVATATAVWVWKQVKLYLHFTCCMLSFIWFTAELHYKEHFFTLHYKEHFLTLHYHYKDHFLKQVL